MGKKRTGPLPALPPVEPPWPTLEDELEEAGDLLAQQEPPERLPSPPRPAPSMMTDYVDPSLIDPAD
jgi:hypothetical protein